MRRLIPALLILTFPAIAYAQLPRAGEAMGNTAAVATTKPMTEYDFEADEIEGGIIKPLDDGVTGETHRKTASLITVKQNFVDELLKSVEDI